MTAPALVQSKIVAIGSSSTPQATFDSPVTAGNIIYVSIASYFSSGSTTTHTSAQDNQGNSYARQGSSQVTPGGSDNYVYNIWLAENVTGGTITVQVNCANTCASGVIIAEITNPLGTSVVDLIKQGTGNSSAPSVTFDGPTSVADSLLVGSMTHNSGNPSITPNGTNLPNQWQENEDNGASEAHNVAARTLTATGTYTANWAVGSSVPWAVTAIVIKGTAGGGAPTVRHLTLLGIGT